MNLRRLSDEERFARYLARPGIRIGTTQGPRSWDGTRFPESARLAVQAGVRAALARRLEGN